MVATPIGHRDDISARAVALLSHVDVVAAEDTRHTGRLLSMLGLAVAQVSLHEHNERDRVPVLVERLKQGEAIALVSDAGTPGISDPGYPLVAAAHAAGIRVVPVPGPTAMVAALSASGQPTDRFVFEGFLPARAGTRQERLRNLATEPRTLVFYESGHRVVAALADLAQAFGDDRPATLARELTKVHETIRCTTLGALAQCVADDADQRRGEIVLVVAGAPESATVASEERLREVLDALLPELAPSRAAAVAARLTGTSRRAAYRAALDRAERDDPEA
ncbi:MAG: 16S rRNA (cytidine(1402)-2'-O)-methyltransferase [Halofilum sp. (in: g-proteobacteria)]